MAFTLFQVRSGGELVPEGPRGGLKAPFTATGEARRKA